MELFVVVALISTLATLAVPNYLRYQRKARQSEARGLLSSFFMTSKAQYFDANCFRGNLVAMGFQPEGELYYRLNSAQNNICILPTQMAAEDDPACISTGQPCNAAQSYRKTWRERITVADGITAVGVTNNTFTASSAGDLGGLAIDEWSINEKKIISNPVSGL